MNWNLVRHVFCLFFHFWIHFGFILLVFVLTFCGFNHGKKKKKKLYSVFSMQHGGAVVITVTSTQRGLGFKSAAGGLDSHQIIQLPSTCPKDMRVRLTANLWMVVCLSVLSVWRPDSLSTVYHTSDSWDGLQPAHDLELAKLSRKWIDDLVDIVYDQSVES